MSTDRSYLRWNGWGFTHEDYGLGDRADKFWGWAAGAVGLSSLPDTPAAALDDTQLPEIALKPEILSSLKRLTAQDRVKIDPFERAFHAVGKSYPDLILIRSGKLDFAPDAVVYPEAEDEVAAVLKLAREENIAVVPYGGGSSVVGGVGAIKKDGQVGVITLDMTRMNRLVALDEEAMTATLEAGIYGPALEDTLQEQGYTLGHYPQSFEFSTLGGWIAARGAGQQSNKYGKAEKWLVSARLATPTGVWQTENFPASAAGPNLNQIVAGHEGTLGVITEATVRIHEVPPVKDYRAFFFRDFFDGVATIREIVQSGLPVAMARLSDPDETHFFQSASTVGTPKERQLRWLLRLLRWRIGPKPCLMLVGVEGPGPKVEGTRDAVRAIAKRNGGFHMGEFLGTTWYKQRFHSPYLRDPMLDHGLSVDTLETATRWSNMRTLYDAVMTAIREAIAQVCPAGITPLVMCHVSHSYHDGASLYFTFVWPRDLDDPLGQWQRIKAAASDAIAAHGGTISHHHGVGTDHAPWFDDEKGEIGLKALKAVKQAVDPDGVLNPGKSFSR